MEAFATPYPIYFQDDDGEAKPCGHIGVHSVLTFKRFQAIMSQKTNLPANQLSAVFVCRRMVGDVDKRQKLPVNENTNFNIILNQHNPTRERDAHFLISIKKSKKDRKGGVGGKKKNDADEEDDDSVEGDAAQSPPDRGRLAAVLNAPPALPVTTLTAAQAREAAQRERERLNVALGRVPSTGTADVRPGAALLAKPVVAAPVVAGRPTVPPVPGPLTGTAASALRGPGAVPAPLAGAAGLQAARMVSLTGGSTQSGPKPLGGALPVNGLPRPNNGIAPGRAGGLMTSSDEGVADGGSLSKAGGCKFCVFCHDRGHEPPFHWCADDRVLPPLRTTPFGAIKQTQIMA